jgi:hypothetical protein
VSDMMPAALMVLVFGGMAAAVFFVVRAQKREEAGRESLALLRGWRYEKFPTVRGQSNYAFSCTSGSPSWELKVHRSREGQHSTTWTSEDAGIGPELVWAGNPGAATVLKGAAVGTMVSAVFRFASAVGAHADGVALDALLADRATLLELPEGPFRERFAVVATDMELAGRLMDDGAQRALLGWDPTGARTFLSASWGSAGLTLRWPFVLTSPDDLDRFVATGVALVRAGRERW